MRFACPHCGYQHARPVVDIGDVWMTDIAPEVRVGSTWCCSECHRPVVIEPQTPEERRDVFAALDAIVSALAELRDKVARATLETRP